jgi:hypothetical protein
MTMADLQVLVVAPSDSSGGFVTQGATGGAQHSGAGEVAGALLQKVVTISSEKLADGVIAVARAIGPSLKDRIAGLNDIAVKEVSIGCTIDLNGHVVVVGVGAQTSVTITFEVTSTA